MSLARQREDHWNSILAGTASYGLLNVHRGASAAALSALYGATFFAGLAGAYLAVESWHSRLLGSGRELPAVAVQAQRRLRGVVLVQVKSKSCFLISLRFACYCSLKLNYLLTAMLNLDKIFISMNIYLNVSPWFPSPEIGTCLYPIIFLQQTN